MVCVVSKVDTETGVKVVETNGDAVRMDLVCAVMSGYIWASS